LPEEHRDTPPDEKLNRLLRLLADRAGGYGVSAEFEGADRMLVDEPVYPAFLALLDDLKENRLISVVFEADPDFPDQMPRMAVEYTVTVQGWKKYCSSGQPAVPGGATNESTRLVSDEAFSRIREDLRAARSAYGHTQEEASEKLKVDPTTISRWERGKGKPYMSKRQEIRHYINNAPPPSSASD